MADDGVAGCPGHGVGGPGAGMGDCGGDRGFRGARGCPKSGRGGVGGVWVGWWVRQCPRIAPRPDLRPFRRFPQCGIPVPPSALARARLSKPSPYYSAIIHRRLPCLCSPVPRHCFAVAPPLSCSVGRGLTPIVRCQCTRVCIPPGPRPITLTVLPPSPSPSLSLLPYPTIPPRPSLQIFFCYAAREE